MLGHLRPASEMPFQWHFAGVPMVVRFVYWIGFLLVILAQTPPSHSVKEVDDTTKLPKLCTWNPTEETFWIRVLILNAPIATKVVCFSRLLKCLRSFNCKQCGPRSDCSYRSSLFWVHAVCFYTYFVGNVR